MIPTTRLWAGIDAEIAKPLVSLLVGAVTLGITVNAGTDLLVQTIGRWWTVLLGVTSTVIVLARPVQTLRRVLRSGWHARVVEIGGPVEGHRGLIVLASPGPGISSAETAIRYHLATESLEHCWLVTGGTGSEQSAAGLIQKLVSEGVPMKRFHPTALAASEADNPHAVYRGINRIYEEAKQVGLEEEEIIGDYTGGTKSMTAGMVLACVSPRRHLQFMKPQRYTADGRAEPGVSSDPVAIDIRFELVPLAQRRV
jgi:hypothetical protein